MSQTASCEAVSIQNVLAGPMLGVPPQPKIVLCAMCVCTAWKYCCAEDPLPGCVQGDSHCSGSNLYAVMRNVLCKPVYLTGHTTSGCVSTASHLAGWASSRLYLVYLTCVVLALPCLW